MQVGDIIKGVKGEAAGIAYLVMQTLGTPGLFGQAFLCRRIDDSSEAVVKTLRAGRPHADRERFFQEAGTLERMADFEQRAGKHYDPDAAPLVQMVMQNPARAAKPTNNGHGGMSSGMPANGGGTQKALAPTVTLPATETSAGSARDKLRQLKELLDDGLIVLEEYEAKRREILSRM